MTTNDHTRQAPQTRSKAVKLTPEIMEYLCVPTKQGASRLLAYFTLVQSAVESTTSYTPLYGRTFDMEAGQLVISITDLAKKWNWARETVRKFLDRLEEFKLLMMEKLDRCTLITMNVEWLDDGYPQVFDVPILSFEMPQHLTDMMLNWLAGGITDDVLLVEIGETVRRFDDHGAHVSPHLVVALQYSLIRQLIYKWSATPNVTASSPDKVCGELLSEIFFSLLSGNWNMWLELLKSYSPHISSVDGNLSAIRTPAIISDGRAKLDSLFKHLNVVFDQHPL